MSTTIQRWPAFHRVLIHPTPLQANTCQVSSMPDHCMVALFSASAGRLWLLALRTSSRPHYTETPNAVVCPVAELLGCQLGSEAGVCQIPECDHHIRHP